MQQEERQAEEQQGRVACGQQRQACGGNGGQHPGDVIFSGTPANSRPVEPGDIVTVECDGLGVLENRIAEGEHDVSDEAGWMPESGDKALGVALGIQLRE